MHEAITMPRLVDRRTLCRILGNVSLSHVIRLDNGGLLGNARVQVGPRIVRYDMTVIRRLIESRDLLK